MSKLNEAFDAKPFASSFEVIKTTTSGVYTKLENSESAVLKLGLTAISPGVSLARSLFATGEPYVDSFVKTLDTSFGPTIQSVQECPQKLADKTEELGKVLDYNQDGVVTVMDLANSSVAGGKMVVGNVVGAVQHRWDELLTVGQGGLDYYLPEYENERGSDDGNHEMDQDDKSSDEAEREAGEPVAHINLSGLTKTASKRVQKRMEQGYGEIRKFSSGRLKEIVHVDLIEYAATVIDHSKGMVSYIEAQTGLLQTEASNLLGEMRPRLTYAIESASNATSALQKTVTDTVDPHRQQFAEKLQAAINNARQSMSPVARAVTPYVGTVSEKVNALGGGFYTLLDTVPVNEIPRDVWLVLAGSLGYRERDPRYDEIVAQIKSLFTAIGDLEKIRSAAQEQVKESKDNEDVEDVSEDVAEDVASPKPQESELSENGDHGGESM